MSTDLLVGKKNQVRINSDWYILGVCWGSLDEESTEFSSIEKLQVSKADCAFTFELKKDGTYLRTHTLYKLFEYSGKWTFENSILSLKDDEGEGSEKKKKKFLKTYISQANLNIQLKRLKKMKKLF